MPTYSTFAPSEKDPDIAQEAPRPADTSPAEFATQASVAEMSGSLCICIRIRVLVISLI